MKPEYSPNTEPQETTISKGKRLLYSQKLAPYVLVSPFVITFVLFFVYPFIQSIIMSFQQVLPGQREFIGLENYENIFSSTFYTALYNTTLYTFWTLVILIPIPLIIAVFLNSKIMYFRNFFRASLFIPSLTSVIVAGAIFRLIFGEMDTALANSILISLGMEAVEWRLNAGTGMFLMVALASWRWMGVNVLYFLAGLQNVPNELYEAAEIDGAGIFRKFFNITLPFLKPITIYVLTISIIAGFRMFEEAYVFWGTNSPGNLALTVVGYLYQQGFQYNDMGFGAAIGVVLMLIILVISIVNLKITGAFKKED